MLTFNINQQYLVNLTRQSDKTEKWMAQLSSGQRINTAADDAAGITIAEKMRSEVNGSTQAVANIQDAVNIVKIGEDGVNGLMPVIDRMRELIVKAGNSTNTQSDKDAMQGEMDQLRGLFAQAYTTAKDFRIALDGKDDSDRVLNFQVGPNANDLVQVDYNPLRNTLGPMVLNMFGYKDLYNSPYQEILAGYVGSPIPNPNDPVPPPPIGPNVPAGTTWDQAYPKVLTVNGSADQTSNALTFLDTNHTALTGQLTYLGSVENRLSATLDQVSSFQIDIADSESKIRDTDMASAMSEMTKSQVVAQAAQAMLAQANQRPAQVLQLLRSGN